MLSFLYALIMLNLQQFVLVSPVPAGNKLLLPAFSEPDRAHCRQCAPQKRQVPTRRLKAPLSAVGQIRSLRPTRNSARPQCIYGGVPYALSSSSAKQSF